MRCKSCNTYNEKAESFDFNSFDEHAKELVIARDDAIKLAKNKTVFLATMSHELRTPMNGILGMSQLLKLGELNKEQSEYVSTIQTSTNL